MRTMLAAAALVVAAFPAQAQTQCGPTPMVEAALMQRFGELPTTGGLTNDSARAIVLWLNEKTKTFSIVGRDPQDGRSCILGGGIEWGVIPAGKPKGGPS